MVDEKNYNEYESHLDNLILQYKNQLESIKNNRYIKENFESDSKNERHSKNYKNEDKILNDSNSKYFEDKPLIKENITSVSKDSNKLEIKPNNKLNELTEENAKLIKQIKELNIQHENLKNEFNKIVNKELEFSNEKRTLEATIKKLENQLNQENKNQLNQEMNLKVKNLEKDYQEKLASKENDMAYLNDRINDLLNENNNKNIIIDFVNTFLNKNLSYIYEDNNSQNEKYYKDFSSFDYREYDQSFRMIDEFINKLLKDNSDLVQHLNKIMNQNQLESGHIKNNKLIDENNELKIENTLLKTQLNNLIENDSIKTLSKNRSNEKLTNNLSNKYKDNDFSNNYAEESDSKQMFDHKNFSHRKIRSDDSFLNSNDKNNKSSMSNFHNPTQKRPIFAKNRERNFDYNNITNNSNFNNDNLRSIFKNQTNFFNKIKEEKYQNQTKYNFLNSDKIISPNSWQREGGEVEISTEIRQIELLKNKIKNLETKIGEINKDEKEKRIIDSLRELRSRNLSPNNS